MSTNHLKFVRYAPEAFAGINSTNAQSMVIFFPDDKPITVFEGDQGLCKTSNMECLKRLLGDREIKNAVNTFDGDKKGELEIEDTDKGCKYIIRFTKTSFSVHRVENDNGKDRKFKVEEPMDFLQQLIGNVSTSPMELKEKKGKDQIEWIRKIVKPTAEQLALEADLKSKKQRAYDDRTEVNKVVKALGSDLNKSGYYSWDDENKVFYENPELEDARKVIASSIMDEKELKEKLNEAQLNNNKLSRAKMALEDVATGIMKCDKEYEEVTLEIERLTARMVSIMDDRSALVKRQEEGTAWVEANKDAEKVLEGINETWLNYNKLQAIQAHVETTTKQHATFLEREQESIKLTAQIDEYTNLQKELVRATTPDIPGLEIFLDGIDPKKEEGIYYNGRSMQELCESELWDLDLLFGAAANVKVKMIENITSLGSAAIERINWFVENGGRVFCTKMDRTQKDLKISFFDKLT